MTNYRTAPINAKSAANKRQVKSKLSKKNMVQQLNDKWLRTKLGVVDGA